MGADGGSIPRRLELVKEKKKESKTSGDVLNSINRMNWFFCTLSKMPLLQPIVACQLGRLYNKEAIYSYLLENSAFGDADVICKHIHKPTDVVTLKLVPNPDYVKEKVDSVGLDTMNESGQFVCPITRKEMNGKHPFSVIFTCGCVLSLEAMNQIPSDHCLVCGKLFRKEDVIPLNPKPEMISDLHAKMLERQIYFKSLKKKQKKEKSEKRKRADDEESTQERKITVQDRKETAQEKKITVQEGAQESTQKGKNEPQISGIAGIQSILEKIPKKAPSEAIQSLYKKDNTDTKSTWLTKGTFNRYVA